MRGILINPRDRTVHSIDTDGKIETMKSIIVCDTVGCARLTADLDMWIDDEGHLQPGKCIFELFPDPTRYAGNAIILGNDGMGSSVAANIGLEKILQIVRWTELVASGQMTEGSQEGNIIRMGVPISGLRPAESYLIWSNDHNCWWGPGSTGYVASIAQAGRYARQHALQICQDARGGWNGITPPPVIPVRLLDAIAAGLEGKIH